MASQRVSQEEVDRRIELALRYEKDGEWTAAIAIYEKLLDTLSGQDAAYVENCAARARQMQQMSREALTELEAANLAGCRRRWLGAVESVRGSLLGAVGLLAIDVLYFGSFTLSMIVCPFWLLGSLIKNALERPGWTIALFRAAMPALTLAVVLASNSLQMKMARTNAHRVVAACDQFHADTGRYPDALDELVPKYLPYVPRAKYCLAFGEFVYFRQSPILMWYAIPPYGRWCYFFDDGHWRYLD